MGVKGLWDILSPAGRRVRTDTLEGRVIAVDVSIWLYQFLKAMRDKEGNVFHGAHLVGFFKRLCKLAHFGVKPIFVFDGPPPDVKRQTLAERRRRREEDAASVKKAAEKLFINFMKRQELARKRRRRDGDDDEAPNTGLTLGDVLGLTNRPEDGGLSEEMDLEYVLGTPPKNEHDEALQYQAERRARRHAYYESIPDNFRGFLAERRRLDEIHIQDDATTMLGEQLTGMSFHERMAAFGISVHDVDAEKEKKRLLITEPSGEFKQYRTRGPQGDETFIQLPLNADIDEEVFRELPTKLQYRILTQLRDQYLQDLRLRAITSRDDAELFSNVQMESYLRTIKSNMEIEKVKRRMGEEIKQAHMGPSSSISHEIDVLRRGVASTEDNSSFLQFYPSALAEGDKADNPETGSSDNPNKSQPISLEERLRRALESRRAEEPSVDAVARARKKAEDALYDDDEEEGGLRGRRKRKRQHLRLFAQWERESEVRSSDAWLLKTGIVQDEAPIEEPAAAAQIVEDANYQPHPGELDDMLEDWLSESVVQAEGVAEQPETETAGPGVGILKRRIQLRKKPVGATQLSKAESREIKPQVNGTEIKPPVQARTLSVSFVEPAMSVATPVATQLLAVATPVTSGTAITVAAPTVFDTAHLLEAPAANLVPHESSASPADDDEGWGDAEYEEVPDVEIPRKDFPAPPPLEDVASLTGWDLSGLDEGINVNGSVKDVEGAVDPQSEPTVEAKSNKRRKAHTEDELSIKEVKVGLSAMGAPLKPFDVEPQQSPSQDANKTPAWETSTSHTQQALRSDTQGTATSSLHETAPVLTSETQHPDTQKTTALRSADIPQPKTPVSVRPSSQDQDLWGAIDAVVARFESKAKSPSSPHTPHVETPMPVTPDQTDSPAPLTTTVIDTPALDWMGLDEDTFQQRLEAAVQVDSTLDADETMEVLEEDAEVFLKSLRKVGAQTEEIHAEMSEDIRRLLRSFGAPYIEAPSEAEAQAVWLVNLGLAEAVMSDDSDSMVFGAPSCFRNFFASQRSVELYSSRDINRSLGLTDESMRLLALLLGCDYTTGVKGIGIVNAMEVVQAYPTYQDLHSFTNWARDIGRIHLAGIEETDTPSQKTYKMKHFKLRGQWEIPEIFPPGRAYEAMINPRVSKSTEPFTWALPDLDQVVAVMTSKGGMQSSQVMETMVPLMQRMAVTLPRRQALLDTFLEPPAEDAVAVYRSKRLRKAVELLTGTPDGSLSEGQSTSEAHTSEAQDASTSTGQSRRKRQTASNKSQAAPKRRIRKRPNNP